MTTLKSTIGQVVRELRRIGRTHYPGFLFGGRIPPGDSYAFVYHDVDPTVFRRDLEFLAANRYATVGIDAFARAASGRDSGRSVLLTFDDARRNFWEVAFPLLVEFDARATLFAPTLWIESQDAEVSGTFMTWEQLRACQASGLVDIESHAHRHALVYTGGQVVAWATPETLATYDIYEWPLRFRGGRELLGPPPLGTPIYAAEPLLSADYGMADRTDVADACVDLVKAAGGAAFFEDARWKSRLIERFREVAAGGVGTTRLDDRTFRMLVTSEFELSREQFESHLGRTPRFLAYPWMLGSELSVDAAKTNDIEAVFGVGLDFRRAREPGGRLPAFGRLKGDWLRFLPGKGRQSLSAVVAGKARGLLRPQHLSH